MRPETCQVAVFHLVLRTKPSELLCATYHDFRKILRLYEKKLTKKLRREWAWFEVKLPDMGQTVRDNIVDMTLSCQGVLPVIPLVALP